MFFSKLLLAAPTEIEKMLLEQQDTLRKLDILSREVKKIKDNPTPEVIKNMYDAPNTLQNPIFDLSNNTIVEKAGRFFDYMDSTMNYLTHPVLIFNAIAGASYWICGIIAIAGVLYYIIGHKNGLKWTGGSLLGYTLIQAINYGLNLL